MKLLRNFSFIALLVVSLVACTATQTTESTGQYIDNAAITAKVKARLIDEQRLSGLNVKVKTYKGTVQLSGFVNNARQAAQAEAIARSVPNVKNVVNNLIVKR